MAPCEMTVYDPHVTLVFSWDPFSWIYKSDETLCYVSVTMVQTKSLHCLNYFELITPKKHSISQETIFQRDIDHMARGETEDLEEDFRSLIVRGSSQ